ncbi:PIN domain-containing protein [Bacillus paranthracis]|uniref:PIN domain-containing protein n=1 Tax=Bacillus paranthracis TaxID=2026186 RepID=UPI003D65AF26
MEEISQETTIESILETKNYCVVFDTNIYLNLYEYSPEAMTFFISLCDLIRDNIILPSTVKREFTKNHSKSVDKQRNKFKNAIINLGKPLNQFQSKFKKQLEILDAFKMPKISDLEEDIQEDIDVLKEKLQQYMVEHEAVEEVNRKLLQDDLIKKLINDIESVGNLLPILSLDEIYQYCADGEKRYVNQTPPGYKDAKDKSGVESYGDFFIWKETLRFCKENDKNLIFVTDDVKEDWYNLTEKHFRNELIEEFQNETGKRIIGITGNEFYNEIARIFNKDIPSGLEWLINYNLENYFDDLWHNIEPDLVEMIINKGEEYIDISSLSSYDGSDFEYDEDSFELEVVEEEFQGYHVDEAEYSLKISIKAKAITREYQGRDDDSKEPILSPNRYHILEGELEVQVTRNIDSYLDYWSSDDLFEEIYINKGILYEIDSYTADDLCVECGRETGEYINSNGEPICDNCITDDSTGVICTDCGQKIPYDDMHDGSYCNSCVRRQEINNYLETKGK